MVRSAAWLLILSVCAAPSWALAAGGARESVARNRALEHNKKVHGGEWRIDGVEHIGGYDHVTASKPGLRGLLSPTARSRTVIDRDSGRIKEHVIKPGALRAMLADQNTMTALGIGLAALAEKAFGMPFDHTSLIFPAFAAVLGSAAAKGLERFDAEQREVATARDQAARQGGEPRAEAAKSTGKATRLKRARPNPSPTAQSTDN